MSSNGVVNFYMRLPTLFATSTARNRERNLRPLFAGAANDFYFTIINT
jgi:hypothetical protein